MLETVIAIAVIAVVVTKLPGAIVDEIRAARGKEPIDRRGYRRDGFWGWLGDVWEDAWADARAARQRRRAGRDPDAPRKPGFRSWAAAKWADGWERAELRRQQARARRLAAARPARPDATDAPDDELVERLSGPCGLCGEKAVTRVGRSWMHINPRTGMPSCVPVWNDRDGWVDGDPSLTIPPDMQRPCPDERCAGVQRPVPGTVIDAGDGHRQALAECDQCGSRWRRWWWERDPAGDNGWIPITPTHDHDDVADDVDLDAHFEAQHRAWHDESEATLAADGQGQGTGPADPGQENTGPVSDLRAERDGVPLDVQLLEPVTAPDGGTEYQEVPTMAEVTGLTTAVAYADGMAKSHQQAVSDAETFAAGLQANGVSGEAIGMAAQLMELEQQVAQAWADLARELGKQTTVQEAYQATPGAGSREFVTSE